jgi:hypothetical protein
MKLFLGLLTYSLIFIVVLCIVAVLVAFPVKWMWNYLMPELFGLKEIGFWQALAMFVLCGLLFKPTSSSSSK